MRSPRYIAAILVMMAPNLSVNGPLAAAECLTTFPGASTILILGEGSVRCNTPVTPLNSHVL